MNVDELDGRIGEGWGGLGPNGSHVNVVGRLQNNTYTDAQGSKVYGFTFTCEEIDYLDSRAESETRGVANG